MMRKLLIISMYFPPFAGAGATRFASLTKFIGQADWEPQVLTADWLPTNTNRYSKTFGSSVKRFVIHKATIPKLASVDSDASKLTRFVTRVKNYVAVRRQFIAWKKSCMRDFEKTTEQHGPFDAMIATAPPWQALEVASKISEQYNIPWIADYRDIFEESMPERKWNAQGDYERKLLKNATCAVTVSEELVGHLENRMELPVHCIPNGFDPDEFMAVEKSKVEKFTITYTGTLYPPGHPSRVSPRILFEVLDDMSNQGVIDIDDFEVVFIGCSASKLSQHINGTKSGQVVKSIEWLERDQAILKQQQATMLLLLGSLECQGIMTSKLFEYLASGRPIVAIPSDNGSIDRVIESCRAGYFASTKREIAKIISDNYGQWKTGKGVRFDGDPKEIEKYSRKTQAYKFLELLEEISDPSTK